MAEKSEDSDEDEEDLGIDLNKTIAEEISKGSIDSKKDFLVKFLRRKLLELGQKQATARTLGEDMSPEKKGKRPVRFRRGDKVSRVKEVAQVGGPLISEEEENLIDDFKP